MAPDPQHIVDILIAERAPKLRASALWPVLRPVLYRLLDYAKARQMVDAITPPDGPPMSGEATMAYVSDLLAVKTDVRGLERVPPAGRLVVVCNHPTGLTDGVALYDALRTVRPDLLIYCNSDALRVNPRLAEVLIPVEWVESKRTRERTRVTLTMSRAVLEAERCIVIFPAGRLAVKRDGWLTDPPWQPTAVSLARKYGAPICPVHLAGPPSTLFHVLDGVSQELRDITLFHEMLNKRGREYDLTVGPLIEGAALEGDPAVVMPAIKAYVERLLPSDPTCAFADFAHAPQP
jgi:putative hemolysin